MNPPERVSPRIRWSLRSLMGLVLFLGVYNAAFVLFQRESFRPPDFRLTDSSRLMLAAFWNGLLFAPLALAAGARTLKAGLRRFGVMRPRPVASNSALPSVPPIYLRLAAFLFDAMYADIMLTFLLMIRMLSVPIDSAPEQMCFSILVSFHMTLVGTCLVTIISLTAWSIVRAYWQQREGRIRAKTTLGADEARNA